MPQYKHTMTKEEGEAVLARAWETNKEHADMPHGARSAMLLASAMMALAQDYYEDPRGIPEHPMKRLLSNPNLGQQAMVWALCMREVEGVLDRTAQSLLLSKGPWNKEA